MVRAEDDGGRGTLQGQAHFAQRGAGLAGNHVGDFAHRVAGVGDDVLNGVAQHALDQGNGTRLRERKRDGSAFAAGNAHDCGYVALRLVRFFDIWLAGHGRQPRHGGEHIDGSLHKGLGKCDIAHGLKLRKRTFTCGKMRLFLEKCCRMQA